MPPKPNGFYMFMTMKQKEIKSKTNRAPTMREMPAICKDTWKALPAAQKAHYDNMAKQERARQQNSGDNGFAKLDSHRQVIADRKDPVKEENKRRTLEKKLLSNSWQGQDVKDIVFYILDFQVMYDDVMEDQHFPLEVGMVSMTLNSGIIDFMHRFIDPGEVPQGNRHLAVSHAENSHKIPLQFEHSDGNLKSLANCMSEFVKSGSEDAEIPPIFCLQTYRRMVENCLDFIYNKVYVPEANKFQRVYCLEDLVHCLISAAGKTQASDSQINDMLRQNRWDYNSSIRCFYHEELDCAHCSLSIVRRYSFAIFDTLSTLLGFKLTDKHMPNEMEEVYTVTEVFGFGRQSARSGFGEDRHDRNWKQSYGSSYSDSYSNGGYPQRGRENAWQGNRGRENSWQGNNGRGNSGRENAWQGNSNGENVWQGNRGRGNAWQGNNSSENAWQGNRGRGNASQGNNSSENAWLGNRGRGNASQGNSSGGNAWQGNSGRENALRGNSSGENSWQSPRVEPVKVSLSDEESEEEEEEEVENTPTVTEYSLGKLRLPNTLAQVQTKVGELSVQEDKPSPSGVNQPATMPPGFGRGSWRGATGAAVGGGAAAAGGSGGPSPIRPMGRGVAPWMGQVRPMGRAAASPVMPPPPPGFERPPMMTQTAMPSQQSQNPVMMNDQNFPSLGGVGRGRGFSRGRGTFFSQQ